MNINNRQRQKLRVNFQSWLWTLLECYENVKTHKSLDSANNMIGITFPNDDIGLYTIEIYPNFKIYKYASNDLSKIFEIPTFLVLDNGKITKIFTSEKTPCLQMLKLSEQKMNKAMYSGIAEGKQ